MAQWRRVILEEDPAALRQPAPRGLAVPLQLGRHTLQLARALLQPPRRGFVPGYL